MSKLKDMPYIIYISIQMTRSCNINKKYELTILCDGTQIHKGEYCSLREISAFLNFPYSTITDIYQDRRKSLNKYQKCKFFPKMEITLLD